MASLTLAGCSLNSDLRSNQGNGGKQFAFAEYEAFPLETSAPPEDDTTQYSVPFQTEAVEPHIFDDSNEVYPTALPTDVVSDPTGPEETNGLLPTETPLFCAVTFPDPVVQPAFMALVENYRNAARMGQLVFPVIDSSGNVIRFVTTATQNCGLAPGEFASLTVRLTENGAVSRATTTALDTDIVSTSMLRRALNQIDLIENAATVGFQTSTANPRVSGLLVRATQGFFAAAAESATIRTLAGFSHRIFTFLSNPYVAAILEILLNPATANAGADYSDCDGFVDPQLRPTLLEYIRQRTLEGEWICAGRKANLSSALAADIRVKIDQYRTEHTRLANGLRRHLARGAHCTYAPREVGGQFLVLQRLWEEAQPFDYTEVCVNGEIVLPPGGAMQQEEITDVPTGFAPGGA